MTVYVETGIDGKKDSISYTHIENCDDDREDYHTIAGRVQNLREWLEEE